MTKLLCTCVIVLLVSCATAPPAASPASPASAAATASPAPAIASTARELVSAVAAGRYADATIRFTPEMRAQLTPAQLEGAWKQLTTQAGSLQRVGDAQQVVEQGFDIVLIPLTFERGTLRARVVFDRSGRVAGLFFIP